MPLILVQSHWRLKSTLPPVNTVLSNQAYSISQCLDLSFLYFFCDLFFEKIDVDLANYAIGKTPYVYDLENENVINLLKKNIDKLFNWFSDNFLKSNHGECQLLIYTDEHFT